MALDGSTPGSHTGGAPVPAVIVPKRSETNTRSVTRRVRVKGVRSVRLDCHASAGNADEGRALCHVVCSSSDPPATFQAVYSPRSDGEISTREVEIPS